MSLRQPTARAVFATLTTVRARAVRSAAVKIEGDRKAWYKHEHEGFDKRLVEIEKVFKKVTDEKARLQAAFDEKMSVLAAEEAKNTEAKDALDDEVDALEEVNRAATSELLEGVVGVDICQDYFPGIVETGDNKGLVAALSAITAYMYDENLRKDEKIEQKDELIRELQAEKVSNKRPRNISTLSNVLSGQVSLSSPVTNSELDAFWSALH